MLSDLRTTGAWSLDDSYNQQFTSWLDWLIFLSDFLYSSRGSQWKIFWGSNCQRGILQLGQVQKTRSNGRSLIRTKDRMIIYGTCLLVDMISNYKWSAIRESDTISWRSSNTMSIALAKVENLTCLYLELRRSLVTDPRFFPRFIVQSMRTKVDKYSNYLSWANSFCWEFLCSLSMEVGESFIAWCCFPNGPKIIGERSQELWFNSRF